MKPFNPSFNSVLSFVLLISALSCKTDIIEPAMAILTTTDLSSILSTSAQSGGDITSDGGSLITVRGVCWSRTAGPTIADSKTSEGTGTGNFVSAITNLSPGTKYYVRAYATNAGGTSYGNEINFITETIDPVVVKLTTNPVRSYWGSGPYWASGGGAITWDGGVSVTVRGVCWGLGQNPTTANTTTKDGSGTGTFESHFYVPILRGAKTYYVRAYAITSAGTFYGNQVSFSTFYRPPF